MRTSTQNPRATGSPEPCNTDRPLGLEEPRSSAAESVLARANMYRFFSAVYLSPPTRALVEQIIDSAFLDDLSVLFGEDAVTELRSFANTSDVDSALDALGQEFMDLFAVPTGRYVTPFEDVYRGRTADGARVWGPLLGERAIDVIRTYREAGAQLDHNIKELPTHVGVELAFMSFLCEREAAVIDATEGTRPDCDGSTDAVRFRDLQRKFLQRHLNSWFPQLSSEIQAKAVSSFYRGLALTTEKFLSRDAASLE